MTTEQKEMLTRHIVEMADVEQDLRFKAKPGRELGNYMIYAIDMLHHQRIRWIIETYGYPTKKMIGADALKKFYLLVQHIAHDTTLQEQCLTHCDFDPKEKAHLMDRILVNQGKPQFFGTQRRRGLDNMLELVPVKDEKNLNKRRARMGLDPL